MNVMVRKRDMGARTDALIERSMGTNDAEVEIALAVSETTNPRRSGALERLRGKTRTLTT
jgi:hypothetical protein